jgi:hypothetical protein
MDKFGMCNKPDRDVPSLTCGYPIPCPYHTITIDMKDSPTVTIPSNGHMKKSTRKKVSEIVDSLKDKK